MPKYVVVESVRSVGVARMGLLWLPLVHFLGSAPLLRIGPTATYGRGYAVGGSGLH
jgi:hypothetical protein